MSNCKHMSFKVIEHEECPECGETDVHKIIDERGIAKLEMMIQEKDAEIELLKMERDEARKLASDWSNEGGAEIERLREALQRFLDNSSIQTNHPDECEFAEGVLCQ